MKLHELREKRAAAVTAMRALADQVETETRDYTADETKRHGDLKTEISGLDTRISRAQDLADAERAAPAVIQGNGKDGRYEERARSFSITKAIAAKCGDDVDAGFEREISKEVATRTGRKFQGIAVPDEVFQVEQRTLLTTGDAASLYPTQHRADLFIDLLRARLVVSALGATVLDNLVGDQEIPRQIGSSQAQWVAEDQSLTETDADFDDVKLSPKTVGALTSFSRRTIINSVPSIEQLVRSDLSAVIAGAIDTAALLGTGTGNQPTGIANVAGVHTVSLAALGWDKVLDFPTEIEMVDALGGKLGWAMNPNAVKKLRSTLKVTGDAGGGYLMEAANALAGYPVQTTTKLPGDTAEAGLVVFGNWADLLIGSWSGTDLLVNPYAETAYAKGRVMVRAMRDVDVAVRRATSFAISDDMAL